MNHYEPSFLDLVYNPERYPHQVQSLDNFAAEFQRIIDKKLASGELNKYFGEDHEQIA
jgi:hypothetical protein